MLALMFKWGAYAEGASAGRMSRTGTSHISNIMLSIVKIGPPARPRTQDRSRPSGITFLLQFALPMRF